MSLPFALLLQILKLEAIFVGPGVIPTDESHGLNLMFQLVSDEHEPLLEKRLILFHNGSYLSNCHLYSWKPRLRGILQEGSLGGDVVVQFV